MQWKVIEKTLEGNARYFRMLEYYDRTGSPPGRKVVRSFTLSRICFEMLKRESVRSGKSMSALLDGMIEKGYASG